MDRFLERQWRRRVWQEVAAAHGLRVAASSSSRKPRPALRAWAGPIEVRFEETPRNCTRIAVVVPDLPGFVGVRVCREQDKPSGEPDIEVGDELFDRTFYVSGPVWLIRALLDIGTRRLLVRVNAGCRLEIADGELRAEMPELHLTGTLPLLLQIGQHFLQLGQHFAQNEGILRRLADNSHRDPEAGVRLQNLRLLIRDHPLDPETAEALRTARSDVSPEIRLEAAKELGAKGREILVELAENATKDATSAQSVSILGVELPFDRVTAILDAALDRRRILTARACLEVIGLGGSTEAIRILAKVLGCEQGELAVAAALALGTTGNPAAEHPLVPVLQKGDTDLQVAAANALARVGTAAAVLPLNDLTEHTDHRAVRKAARQAIAEIQSRLQGASPGQLSLTVAEAGQLSLAPDEAGQLSLATDPAGELSLSDGEAG